MSLIMLAPLTGGAIGPAICGAIASSLGWRKILWISAALSIACEICFFTLFRETYKVTILKKRAARLREETKDDTIRCSWEEEEEKSSVWSALRVSIMRPLIVGRDSFVLQILTFYGGWVFSIFYVLATTFPEILRDVYHFSPPVIGTSFLSFSK
jgi:MFS family permease